MPKYSIVKSVTLHVARIVISIRIFLTRKHKRLTLPVQKMPKYFIVKSVTLHVVRRVILIRIFDL